MLFNPLRWIILRTCAHASHDDGSACQHTCNHKCSRNACILRTERANACICTTNKVRAWHTCVRVWSWLSSMHAHTDLYNGRQFVSSIFVGKSTMHQCAPLPMCTTAQLNKSGQAYAYALNKVYKHIWPTSNRPARHVPNPAWCKQTPPQWESSSASTINNSTSTSTSNWQSMRNTSMLQFSKIQQKRYSFDVSGHGTMTGTTRHVFPLILHPISSKSDGYGPTFKCF
jgi:hypothetical protein